MPTCKNLWIDSLVISLNDDLSVKSIENKLVKVLGQDKSKYVIDDDLFTKLDKEKAKRGRHQFNTVVGEIVIRDYSKDDYLRRDYGFFVIIVHHFGIRKKILQNRINKRVNAYIHEKIGAYLSCKKCQIKL